MRVRKYIAFSVLYCLVSTCYVHAQNHIVDSLKAYVKTAKDDTNKVNALNTLSDQLEDLSKYDSSLACASDAELLAAQLDYKRGMAAAYRNIGIVSSDKGDYTKALEYHFKGVAIYESMHNIKGLAACYGNIGIVYIEQGNYPQALEYDFKSLAIKEQLGNKLGIAISLGNIGNVYYAQGNYNKAIGYEFEALDRYKDVGDASGIALSYGNIGNIYEDKSNYTKALEYHFKALAKEEEIDDKSGIARSYGNIGAAYLDLNKYDKALEYDFKSLALFRQVGYESGVATAFDNIGLVNMGLKNYALSRMYLDSALVLSKKIGSKEETKIVYNRLAKLDNAVGNYKAAFEDYKKYVAYNDSITNDANTKKTVQAEMNFEFNKKQAAEKAEQGKKDAIAEQQRKKQSIIRNSFIAAFVLMLALAFLIFRSYRQKQKANLIILKQKEEVEQQKEIAEQQKALVEQQKVLVEEKNKEILDSITYAKRLQDAILPPLSLITKYLPESFVLYKPKDIVAGDFYWMEVAHPQPFPVGRENEKQKVLPIGEDLGGATVLIAAADCTGHGVPGALVSVVCSNALNRTVKEFGITEPGKILDKVRELVLETFEKSESNVQDGMDISLLAISRQSSVDSIQIQWSGAYNSLFYIVDGKMMALPADKQPIGKTDNPKPFTTHSITLNPPSEGREAGILYLFTDGYADQFGGPKGKKFMNKQLQEMLSVISRQSMSEQKNILEKTFEEWKGGLEQVDDVLIIGIRV
ncbi:MAG TPA: tetratricopeptide repeat protein [Bacteroidia bacterium]|nr:tetratricopeptide repeat protein [Bacteroidia bacterium]